jgi:hypothetical protein
MAYFLNLFSPQTYEAFSNSGQSISGFRLSQQKLAERVRPGDRFVCYMTGLSRWIGILDILSDCFVDDTPYYFEEDDPFIVRFRVRPIIWLPVQHTVPIHSDELWNALTFTKDHDKNTSQWTGKLRSSLNQLSDADGQLLERVLRRQAEQPERFEINESKYRRLVTQRVRRPDRVVSVTVPVDDDEQGDTPVATQRESIRMQALLARVGEKMGFSIWLPRQDRAAVLTEWNSEGESLLPVLPLNYDEATIRTVEQIDVLWLKRRTIIRAFEVEHTTAIYSGILRMADLLALQPNLDIKLHLVAPAERRDKVFQEILRPVFSLLERGPLAEYCSFISYDSLRDLASNRYLSHLSDSVIEEYAEEAES